MGDRLTTLEIDLRAKMGAMVARAPILRRVLETTRRHNMLAAFILYSSLPLILIYLIVARPPTPFYALLLAPIALAAVLHEFVGGLLAALAAIAGVALLIALDLDAARRAVTLQEAWPILIMYLAVGPLVGWLAAGERDRLFQAERRWTRQITAVGDACREIAASLNLDRTLRLVMTKAAETLPMDAGVLFRFDPESQAYRVAISHNISPDHVARITFAFDEGVPGWVVKHRQPLIVPDATADARVHPHVVEEGILSVLAIPLVAHEQMVGVLNLFSKTEVNSFDNEALRLAQVFADQAAVFIENARLVDELRQAAAELEARVERRTKQLQETQSQMIRAEKLAVVGRLAASVAHEVNNPLQAIALHLQLVAEEGLTGPAQGQMSVVQQELARIAGIVQRLLDFQRPKPGKRAPHNVWELLNDVLALADKQLQQSNITVTREDTTGLEPVLAVGDQLKQVFLNLVLNAIEAMPDGGELHIRAGQSNGAITIAFIDCGVGMTQEVMDQLFEPFFSTKRGGTGLGLAVSHEIVTQYGGALEANSLPDEGSTFTVTLPAHNTPDT